MLGTDELFSVEIRGKPGYTNSHKESLVKLVAQT
jgi:hypothetical protein